MPEIRLLAAVALSTFITTIAVAADVEHGKEL
jgi:hypothetical protein